MTTKPHTAPLLNCLNSGHSQNIKLVAVFVCLVLVTGCGQIYRERWPVETRPDIKQVADEIELEVAAIEGVTYAQVGLGGGGLSVNDVSISVRYASTDPNRLTEIANQVEAMVAPKLVALRDDGTLTVKVKSDNRDLMPYESFYPDHGRIGVTWDELAKIHGLKRPNPWRR